MRAGVVWGVVTPVVVLSLAAGYAVADAADVVPGWITTQPEPVPPAALIDVPTATPGDGPALQVADLDPNAPMPSADAVQGIAEALRDDSRTGDSTNVSIVDMLTGDVLADLSATDPQIPASTTKLLTGVAVAHELGPDHRLRTSAVWRESTNTVTLVAGGDLMLAADAGHGGSEIDANGYAGLGDLADAISESIGEQTSRIRLAVDDLDFPEPYINPEWPAYAVNMGYAAPVTGLAVNIARLGPEEYAARSVDPSMAALDILATRLEERGFTVTTVGRVEAPADAVEVGFVDSAPLSQVVEHMLHMSDNTLAEALGRVLALEDGRQGNPAGAARSVREAIDDMGVDTTGLQLFDGAGFSDRNQISPAQLTATLVATQTDPNTRWLQSWLALAGLEGTVAERFADTDAAGMMRAKTGSLTGVTSLAGTVVTADGRLLGFATLMDGMEPGQANPRAALDDFVLALAGCGCEGE